MNKYEIYNLTINDPKAAKELLISMALKKVYNDTDDMRDAFVHGVARLHFTNNDHIIRNSLLEISEKLWYSKDSIRKNDRVMCNMAVETAADLTDDLDQLDLLFMFLHPAQGNIDVRSTVIKCLYKKAINANEEELGVLSTSKFSYKISELATRLVHPDAIVLGEVGSIGAYSLAFLILIQHLNSEMLVERLQDQPGLGWFSVRVKDLVMSNISPFHPNYMFVKEMALQLAELEYENRFV